jgi:hypothetical protein
MAEIVFDYILYGWVWCLTFAFMAWVTTKVMKNKDR